MREMWGDSLEFGTILKEKKLPTPVWDRSSMDKFLNNFKIFSGKSAIKRWKRKHKNKPPDIKKTFLQGKYDGVLKMIFF